MSIDTGFIWSAKTLQTPVHQHLQKANAMAQAATSRLPDKGPWAEIARRHQQSMVEQQILGKQQTAAADPSGFFKTPEEKAWALKHPGKAAAYMGQVGKLGGNRGDATDFILGKPVPPGWAEKHQKAVAAAGPASDIATKVMSGVYGSGGPGQPVAKNPYEIKTPGVNPAIATAVPPAPSTGIPTMAATSGWLAPGANFQIR